MQYRTLGRTGLRVSEVGYGGGRVAPNQERRPLIDMLHSAFEVGLNYLDTAPDYGGGFSEDMSLAKLSRDDGTSASSQRRPKPSTPRASWRMWMGV